jgi:predicted O-linked N-acetylglucosamine transferase (SPINDLY family)
LDAVVYLDGLMSPAGIRLLSHRIAKRQVFWLGHAGPLPLPFVDATLVDRNVLPPRFRDNPTGGLVFLPPPYHCFTNRPAPLPEDERDTQRGLAGVPPGAFVFCGFNNPEKLTPQTLEAWCCILRRVPRGILWLSNQFNQSELVGNIGRFAAARDVSPDRIRFFGREPEKRRHLSRHRAADLFLDTFSLNASTTALDALCMNLPILTLAGDRFSNRIAASFLKILGLDELIVESVEAYIEEAVALASDPTRLARYNARLGQADAFDAAFGPQFFAPKLEEALRNLR